MRLQFYSSICPKTQLQHPLMTHRDTYRVKQLSSFVWSFPPYSVDCKSPFLPLPVPLPLPVTLPLQVLQCLPIPLPPPVPLPYSTLTPAHARTTTHTSAPAPTPQSLLLPQPLPVPVLQPLLWPVPQPLPSPGPQPLGPGVDVLQMARVLSLCAVSAWAPVRWQCRCVWSLGAEHY